MEQIEQRLKLEEIFMPASKKARDDFYKRDPLTGSVEQLAPFVHYTTAEAALSIIKTKRIWMRNTMTMADYSEVQHGYNVLLNFFKDEKKKNAFISALDLCAPGAALEAINHFDKQWNDIRYQTYITSLSEHVPSEDQHGRLSMWRAFGGNTARVALVINIPWNSSIGQTLNLSFSPVTYAQEGELHEMLLNVAANVKSNLDFLNAVGRQAIVNWIFTMLLISVTCMKHEGFHEEREWRAIYSPYRTPSSLISYSTEIINGVPQVIHKIPLDAKVTPELITLDLAHIFNRLIIGPTQYTWPMYDAFVNTLHEAGIAREFAQQRVRVSSIPIRTT